MTMNNNFKLTRDFYIICIGFMLMFFGKKGPNFAGVGFVDVYNLLYLFLGYNNPLLNPLIIINEYISYVTCFIGFLVFVVGLILFIKDLFNIKNNRSE